MMANVEFPIFYDGRWNFVEHLKIGHQNSWRYIIFPSGPIINKILFQIRFSKTVKNTKLFIIFQLTCRVIELH